MEYEYESNLYEDFMKKHLSHYGYYTGKNELYRARASFTEWNSTYGYLLSSSTDTAGETKESKHPDTHPSHGGAEKRRTTQLLFDSESDRLVSRLKEPRHLFVETASLLGPQQLARWPAEIEVADEPVKHIQPLRPKEEPFYVPSGFEEAPDIVGTSCGGTVVFELKAKPGLFFQQSRVGGLSRDSVSQVAAPLCGPEDETLLFESRFESGNLERAVKVGPFEYELWMRNDLYTNKHTQWFYFRVSNTRRNAVYRFTICNFTKGSSLYGDGMRPLSYSVTESAKAGSRLAGWHRSGTNIKYYKTNNRYLAGKAECNFYALTFTTQFTHDNDTVYFAHCYPYTYSDLQDYLGEVLKDEEKTKLCKLKVLCRTLAGNLVYLMTITAPEDYNKEDCGKKKAVIISARVHPGETNSSWIMKGIIDYLLSNESSAQLLRDRFIFKIVPMLNPDGVIVGNYRCSLSGRDLNRNYTSSLKDSYPAIWHTKQMIQKTLTERDVMLYCDVHGHSKKQNVFIYGCENRMNSGFWLHERVFPAMLGSLAYDHFNYDDCNFKVQKSKEGTGRITVWNMGVVNSYTMEATFCGGTIGAMKDRHYNTMHFEQMGKHFCDALLDFCDPEKFQCSLKSVEQSLKSSIVAKLSQSGGAASDARTLQYRSLIDAIAPEQLDLNELYTLYLEECRKKGAVEEDEGSNSSDSDGLPVKLQYMEKLSSMKKKKKAKRKAEERPRHGKLAAASSAENRRSSSVSRAAAAAVPKARDAASEAAIKIYTQRRRHQKCKTQAAVQKADQPKAVSTPAMEFPGDGSVLASAENAATDDVRPDPYASSTALTSGGTTVSNQATISAQRGKLKGISLRTMTNAYLTKGLDVPPPDVAKALPHFKYSTGQHGTHVVTASMVDLCTTAASALSAPRSLQQVRSDVLRESAYRNHLSRSDRPYKYSSFETPSAADTAAECLSTAKQRPSVTADGGEGDYIGVEDERRGRSAAEDQLCSRLSPSLTSYQMNGKPLKQHPPPFDESLEFNKHSGFVGTANSSVAGFLDYRVSDDKARHRGAGSPSSISAHLLKRASSTKRETMPSTKSTMACHDSAAGTASDSAGCTRVRRYIDEMVKQTDDAIQYLTNQIEGMQRKEQSDGTHAGRLLDNEVRTSSQLSSREQLLVRRYHNRAVCESTSSSSHYPMGKRFFF